MKHYCMKQKKRIEVKELVENCMECKPTLASGLSFCRVRATFQIDLMQKVKEMLGLKLKEVQDGKTT